MLSVEVGCDVYFVNFYLAIYNELEQVSNYNIVKLLAFYFHDKFHKIWKSFGVLFNFTKLDG